MRNVRVRILVESAVMIALATVLSLIKVYSLPQGGSITLGSMLPILFIGFRWGARAGLATGVVYGVLQYIVEPFFVHPVQVILDYPVAFGLLGLSGLFRGPTALSGALGAFTGLGGRYLAHFLSGWVFFAEYAPAGTSPVVYSLVYNATYLGPELVVTLVLGALLPVTLRRAQPVQG